MQRIATQVHASRAFQTSAACHVRRRTTRKPLAKPEPSQMTPQELFNLEDIQEFADEDTSGAGHRIAAQEREVLNYFRLIDGQMQELQGMVTLVSNTYWFLMQQDSIQAALCATRSERKTSRVAIHLVRKREASSDPKDSSCRTRVKSTSKLTGKSA
jgi:hypothetical protein